MVAFGEKVLYKAPNLAVLPKTAPRWGTGIRVERSEGSNQHVLLADYGAIPARAINKRLPGIRQWQADELRRVRGQPMAVRIPVPVEKMESQGDERSSDSSVKLGSNGPLGSARPMGENLRTGSIMDSGGQADDADEHEQVDEQKEPLMDIELARTRRKFDERGSFCCRNSARSKRRMSFQVGRQATRRRCDVAFYSRGRQAQELECGAAGDMPTYAYHIGCGQFRVVDLGKGIRERADAPRECASTRHGQRGSVRAHPERVREAVGAGLAGGSVVVEVGGGRIRAHSGRGEFAR